MSEQGTNSTYQGIAKDVKRAADRLSLEQFH